MFADYLKELQKVALLAPAEERSHWDRYRHHHDAASRAALIEAYQPLVFKVVMHLRPPDGLLMDMIQEGTIGLIEAVERFDHERGVRFSTFAMYRIRGRVLNSLRRDHLVQYSLDQDWQDDLPLANRLADPASEDAMASIEDRAVVARMWDVVESLPSRERAILQATYFEAKEPRSVAAELRISLSHFYRLQKQAIDRVRAIVLDDMHQAGKAYG
ncbi:MAG TPA: sigma-70 family RNA polymerase sigma factor [bacterium]|jgi:RNA polymerase sporulation-specific sigma factor